jgi:hypothetical protein
VSVEKRQLLRTVRGIIGRVQIDRDQTSTTPQSFTMPSDHGVGQCFCHAKQFLAIRSIFKARESRLRSQIVSLLRIPTDQQFVHRVAGQTRGIVRIFITTGDGHDALREEFMQFVPHFSLLSLVFQTRGQGRNEAQTLVSSFQ